MTDEISQLKQEINYFKEERDRYRSELERFTRRIQKMAVPPLVIGRITAMIEDWAIFQHSNGIYYMVALPTNEIKIGDTVAVDLNTLKIVKILAPNSIENESIQEFLGQKEAKFTEHLEKLKLVSSKVDRKSVV